MKSLGIILIVAGASAAFAIYVMSKRKTSEQSRETRGGVREIVPRSDDAKIKSIIGKYIEFYLNERKQHYLYNVYSVQFDLFDYNKTYDSQPIKASFESLGIVYEDYQAARNIIKKELSNLSKIPTERLSSKVNENGLILLLDYYDIKAQQVALDEVKDRINEKNKERYARYLSEVKEKENNFINSLT